ncbi:MAG: TonB-dependent receptor [Chitinophagaceae bacterium]
MKQFVVWMLLCITTVQLAIAQGNNGSVNGKITTTDGKAAASVTVQINGSKKAALTDEEGKFIIPHVAAGNYTLRITLVGYETQEQAITVTAGKATSITLQLKLSQSQLDEVIVTSGNNKFARKQSDYVAKLPITNLENPQVYNVVGKELMKEQIITSFDDALKSVPGVIQLWASTGRSGDGAGYYSIRGFAVQPKVVNGIAGASNGSPDPANIERIEVIKGPSGTLFGSSLVSFGGLINVVTKKPYDKFGAEASYTAGTYGLNRITADVNTPLDQDKKLLFRLNTAYHYQGSWQDAGFKRSFFVAPSLSYQVNDKLNISLNTEFYNNESTNAEMLFLTRNTPLKVFRPEDIKIDYKRSFTSNDITIKNPVMNVNGQINYEFAKGWISQTAVSRSSRKSNGYYSYLSMIDGDSSLARIISNQNSVSEFTDLQQNFIGRFNIGSLKNRVVVGLDFLSSKTENNNSPYITFDVVTYNTYNGVADPNYVKLNKASLDAKLAASTAAPTKNRSIVNTYSAYISDVLNITDNLVAMLSLRVDRFDNRGTYNLSTNTTAVGYAQTAWSPKLGLVYELIKNRVSVFGNYMNGFQNVGNINTANGAVPGKPQQANQWEAGIKTEMLAGKITGSISYYDISVTNVTRPDPANVAFSIQDGNIKSKGFEADIIANPLSGLNIVAGYSYNDSKNEKTSKSIEGRRPVSAGPKHLVNLWASYKISKGKLQGLGIGAGGNYASENIITNDATPGQFILPEYTIFNGTIFYEKAGFRFGLKLNNAFNKKYWSGWTTVEPQMPRSVTGSISVRL